MKFVINHLKGTFIAGLFVMIPIGITRRGGRQLTASAPPASGRRAASK